MTSTRSSTSVRRRIAWIASVFLASALAATGPLRADDANPRGAEPATDENMPSAAEFETFASASTIDDEAARSVVRAIRQLVVDTGAGQIRELECNEVLTLAARPVVALEFFRETFVTLPAALRTEGSGLATYFAKLRRAVQLMAARAKQTPESRTAVAYFRLAEVRLNVLSKSAITVPAARAAATALRSNAVVAALPDDAWREFLVECFGVARSDGDRAWVDWMGDELQFYAKRHPEDLPFVRSACEFDISRGEEFIETDPKGAGPVLVRGLNGLGAEGVLTPENLALTKRLNRGITVAKIAGFSPTVGYRTRTIWSAGNYVRADVPIGGDWKAEEADGDQEEWSLGRIGDHGPGATVTVWKYKTSTDYVDEEGKVVGGDNIGARLKRSMNDWRAQVARVKKISPTIGRLSKSIAGTRGFEVRGKDDLKDEFRVREWYWRSELWPMYVFNVVVLQTGGNLDRDPEMDKFLETFHETPKEK